MTTKTKTTWRTVRLGAVCPVVFSGGTPDTRVSAYWRGNLPWLSSGETSQTFVTKTDKHISEEAVKNSSTRLAKDGDVVIATAGQGWTRGQTSVLKIDTYINQSLIALRPNSEELNPLFLFYNLRLRYPELRSLSDSTSSRGSITGPLMKDLMLKVPEVSEQKRIAGVLAAFDEKIENNNSIIKTLEEMAQAIFKKQFDVPVDNLPEGWEVKTLGDLGKVVTGKTPSTKDRENFGTDYPFITIPDLQNGVFVIKTERFLSDRGANTMRASKLPAGAICVSCIATIGLVGIVTRESFTNQQINSIISHSKILQPFIFLLLQKMKGSLQAYASGGTAAPIISKSAFEKIEVVLPAEKVLKDFYEIVNPMFDKVLAILEENQKLAAMRDLLLPRLMSGEIQV